MYGKMGSTTEGKQRQITNVQLSYHEVCDKKTPRLIQLEGGGVTVRCNSKTGKSKLLDCSGSSAELWEANECGGVDYKKGSNVWNRTCCSSIQIYETSNRGMSDVYGCKIPRQIDAFASWLHSMHNGILNKKNGGDMRQEKRWTAQSLATNGPGTPAVLALLSLMQQPCNDFRNMQPSLRRADVIVVGGT
jgi:hypothetical protein